MKTSSRIIRSMRSCAIARSIIPNIINRRGSSRKSQYSVRSGFGLPTLDSSQVEIVGQMTLRRPVSITRMVGTFLRSVSFSTERAMPEA